LSAKDNAMAGLWTKDERTEFDDRMARSSGHRQACAIAAALFALLDRIDGYLELHGDGCTCEFCGQADEAGIRDGVAVAETLAGSVALLTMLAGAIDGHTSAEDLKLAGQIDVDRPDIITSSDSNGAV
jgi:hypothetical protein